MMAARKQCKKCPWKTSTDPHEIPGGYSEEKHRGLVNTIAKAASLEYGGLRVMACHETTCKRPLPCVGWIHNQVGVGNNIGLRLAVLTGAVDGNVEVVGPQHDRFEDTLP